LRARKHDTSEKIPEGPLDQWGRVKTKRSPAPVEKERMCRKEKKERKKERKKEIKRRKTGSKANQVRDLNWCRERDDGAIIQLPGFPH